MLGRPALLRAYGAQLDVAVDDGPHEVVGLVQSLSGEGLGVGVALAQVGVVADGKRVRPGPDVPKSRAGAGENREQEDPGSYPVNRDTASHIS